MSTYVIVSDLASHHRERLSLPLDLKIGESLVAAPADVSVVLEPVFGGVAGEFEVSTVASYVCPRCLTEWEEPLAVTFQRVFTNVPDEDGYHIDAAGRLDIEPAVRDEVAMVLPTTKLCRPDCAGLCPTCGNDLNMGSCVGHGEDDPSPFAALKDLFDT